MTTLARRDALRRYPALGFIAFAGVLAVALPSALTVPNAGPPTLAEFAPVPGQGQGNGGDLGRLGAGSSGDLGLGPGQGPPQGPGGGPGQPAADLKRCVGDPPRQTEDPLSPPCVAFFEGDNGGATWRGVNEDEIVVVAYFRRTRSSTTGQSSPPEGTLIDYDEPISSDDFYLDRAMKIYARYFNDRYQTYGRHVHLYGLYTVPFTDSNVIQQRRADAVRIDRELRPFATIAFSANPIQPFIEEAAARGMVSVTYSAFRRGFYAGDAPLVWGSLPDLEDQATLEASYICRKLARRSAIHSGNPTDISRERVFGLAYTRSEREEQYAELAALIRHELRRGCGVEIAAEASASEVFEDAQGDAALGIAALRDAGVTTVITAGLPNTALAFTSAASATGWTPEWFVAGRREHNGLDQGGAAKLMPQDQWRHAFGVTFASRWGRDEDMHWSRSYRETCSCSPTERYWTSGLYDPLALLFYGIQAGGPRLTPKSFAKGMHAIPKRPSPNVYTPAAYFTPGNFTFIKDAMEIWWDPAGQAPTDTGPGCYRIPNGGRRFRAGEWRAGDRDAFRDGPCNGHAPV